MSILEGVLREEQTRLKNNISYYETMLLSLPRGTIFIKKTKNSSFVYRRRKVNGKVVSEYLGKLGSNNVKKQIELSIEYKRIKNNIRIVKKELVKLNKAIKAYD